MSVGTKIVFSDRVNGELICVSKIRSFTRFLELYFRVCQDPSSLKRFASLTAKFPCKLFFAIKMKTNVVKNVKQFISSACEKFCRVSRLDYPSVLTREQHSHGMSVIQVVFQSICDTEEQWHKFRGIFEAQIQEVSNIWISSEQMRFPSDVECLPLAPLVLLGSYTPEYGRSPVELLIGIPFNIENLRSMWIHVAAPLLSSSSSLPLIQKVTVKQPQLQSLMFSGNSSIHKLFAFLSPFLNKKTKTSGKMPTTHTRMNGAAYNIPDHKLSEFMNLYIQALPDTLLALDNEHWQLFCKSCFFFRTKMFLFLIFYFGIHF